jgi:branched-chain amino acid transport system substrate-binding protein
MLNRRQFALGIAAVAGASGAIKGAAAQTGPIRVGFLTVNSGALAAGGRQLEDGIKLFLKQRDNKIGGRPVVLIIADTAGQPANTHRNGEGSACEGPTVP